MPCVLEAHPASSTCRRGCPGPPRRGSWWCTRRASRASAWARPSRPSENERVRSENELAEAERSLLRQQKSWETDAKPWIFNGKPRKTHGFSIRYVPSRGSKDPRRALLQPHELAPSLQAFLIPRSQASSRHGVVGHLAGHSGPGHHGLVGLEPRGGHALQPVARQIQLALLNACLDDARIASAPSKTALGS